MDPEPVVLLRMECRLCCWADGSTRRWIATREAHERSGICPFCGDANPVVVTVIEGPGKQ